MMMMMIELNNKKPSCS